jgi:hypothetical protein
MNESGAAIMLPRFMSWFRIDADQASSMPGSAPAADQIPVAPDQVAVAPDNIRPAD